MTARPGAREDPVLGRAPARLAAPLAAASFAVWWALLPAVTVTLAVRVQEVAPGREAEVLSFVLATGAVVALVSQNVAGLLSDRTAGRFGRRRPWLLAGALAGAACLCGVAAARTPAQLALAWALVQLSFNVVLAGLNPLLAEQVPSSRRGAVGGLLGLTAPAAILTGAWVLAAAPSTTWALLVPAVVAVGAVTWLVSVLHDRPLRRPAPALRWHDAVRAFWVSPRASADFSWAWCSRVLVFAGSSTLSTYQVLYLRDRLGVAADDVPDTVLRVLLVSTVGTVVAAPLLGALSDRVGRRKVFVVASALLLAATHVGAARAPDVEAFVLVAAVKGVALGCYLAVDLALVTDVLPDREQAGRWMAVFHLANVFPQVLVPVAAPLLLSVGGGGDAYGVLFGAAALAGLVGAALTLPIRGVR